MVKLLMASAALCAFFIAGSQATFNMTEFQLENTYTLASNQHFYTTWLTNTSLHSNSTLPFVEPCTMAIDPTKDFTIDRIQAEVLKTGIKYVVWGLRNFSAWKISNDVAGSRSWVEVEYMVLLVDPWHCNYKSVPVPTYKRDSGEDLGDILVVTYEDSFDVFLPGQQNCSPCRFDDKGNKVELEHQLELTSPNLAPYVSPRGLHIQQVHWVDEKSGYFFARNFENNTAVIEHLDQYFKTLKQLYVDHPVHSVSISNGKELIFSMCYALHNNHTEVSSRQLEVHCQQLDSNFQPKNSIRLPVPKNSFVYGKLHLSHRADSLYLYVGLIESNFKESEEIYKYQPRHLRYFAYDLTGKLLDSQDLDIAEVNLMTKIKSDHHYKGLLYNQLILGVKFCLFIDNFVSKDEVKIHELSWCFDTQKLNSKSP